MKDSPAEFESITCQISRKPGDWTPRVVSRLWEWGPACKKMLTLEFQLQGNEFC